MNLDINQQEAWITTPDDSMKFVHDVALPPGQPKVVIPTPAARDIGVLPNRKSIGASRGNLYGMALAWRGLNLLGIALGIATVWFVWEWFRHGRMPLGLFPAPRYGIGYPPSPVFPPIWLGIILVPMGVISICMMVLGTQDVISKMRFKKHEEPHKTHV